MCATGSIIHIIDLTTHKYHSRIIEHSAKFMQFVMDTNYIGCGSIQYKIILLCYVYWVR